MIVYEVVLYETWADTPHLRRICSNRREATRYMNATHRTWKQQRVAHDIYLSRQVWPDTKKGAIALANNAPKGVMISTKVVDSRSVKSKGGGDA